MTTRVLKWVVPVDDEYHYIGFGPVALVDMQNFNLCVWTIEKSPETEPYTREVRVFGTGHEVPEGHVHMGSAQNGPYVWHIFWRLP